MLCVAGIISFEFKNLQQFDFLSQKSSKFRRHSDSDMVWYFAIFFLSGNVLILSFSILHDFLFGISRPNILVKQIFSFVLKFLFTKSSKIFKRLLRVNHSNLDVHVDL